MTAAPFCDVFQKPSCCPAIRFDGTPEMAQIIIDWVCSAAPHLGRGHHRTAYGRTPAAVFQPLIGKTLMARTGEWVVRHGSDDFVAYTPDAFAANFEVVP